ncbi:MAG: polysaccharide deacetylase family protein [Saprospiraceae bacterium]
MTEVNEKVIGWNVRSLDTVIKDPDRLLNRIQKKLEPGSIILLHDNQPGLIDFLPRLLELLKKEQYEIVPLDELIGQPAYE